MIEEFKSNGWKDFQQRYQGVYGWFEKEDKSQLLVKLTVVTENELVFTDKNKLRFSAIADQGNKFSFLPVVRGLYNTERGVVYVSRIPAKQYRRGICQDNTSILDVATGAPLDVGFNMLEGIYGYSQQPAITSFKRLGGGNAALDNTFAVVDNSVYVYNVKIGVYDAPKAKFILSNKLFQQEMTDVCTRLQLPLLVDVK